jgi:hypothetical protein
MNRTILLCDIVPIPCLEPMRLAVMTYYNALGIITEPHPAYVVRGTAYTLLARPNKFVFLGLV